MGRPPRPPREQLRQQLLHQAAQAFDLMSDDDEDLVTFDQRQRRADDLGQALALRLPRGRAGAGPAADPPPDQVVPCPRRRRPAQRQDDPDQPSPDRPLTVASGQRVLLRRARFRRPACRAVFPPPDDRPRPATEGYSPAVSRKAAFARGQDAFAPASQAPRELAGLPISPGRPRRLTRRLGSGWVERRGRDVAAFRAGQSPIASATRAPVASVTPDGGRLQRRAEGGGGGGVRQPGWREFKAACLETRGGRVQLDDPRPGPPGRFLDRGQVARPAAGLKANRGRGRAAACRERVRAALASQASSDAFGWQVAAEAHRRGLHRATSKAYVCGGQKYDWPIREMRLRPLGFVAVLDFVRLVVHLRAAARAAFGRGTGAARAAYERWLRQAWSGESGRPPRGPREQGERLGPAPPGCSEGDPRRVAAEAVGYVGSNRSRVDYPRYRKPGLPTSGAPVESTTKRLNRRLKGAEKFRGAGGGEALLTARAACLSEDGRVGRHWARPRPRGRAVGAGRLRAR